MFDRRPAPRYSFFLRNRRTSQAVGGQVDPVWSRHHLPNPWRLSAYSMLPSPFGFFARAQRIVFPSSAIAQLTLPSAPPPGTWDDDLWLRDAELVIVRSTPAGSVVRSLELGVTVNEGR
jgi:hypothetical protein